MKLSHDDYDWMYGAPYAKDYGCFFCWLFGRIVEWLKKESDHD